jgi:hypothetical protein
MKELQTSAKGKSQPITESGVLPGLPMSLFLCFLKKSADYL